MKKLLSAILIACLGLSLVSCGSGTLAGEPAAFTNSDKSFSIELPAEDGSADSGSWIINEEAAGDILDLTDSSETVRVVVQGVSKAKMARVAPDLESYKTYSTENTFAEFLSGAELKETSVEVPEFVSNSSAATYSIKKYEGAAIFMETDNAYYTYLVIAAEGGYKANEKFFKESILSFKEQAS